MRPSLFAHATLLALVALVPGCRSCSHEAAPLDSVVVGPLGSVDDVDFAPYLAAAHAIVTHVAKPAGTPPTHVGQRAFVTFWSPGHAAVRGTGLGATLFESVTQASEEVAKTAAGDGRVEIDVLTTAEPAVVSNEMRDSIFAIGTQGYLATDGAAHVGFVTPNEIIADKLVDLDSEKNHTVAFFPDLMRGRLADRAAVALTVVDGMRAARFGVSERVEAAKAGAPPITLVRSMPSHGADVTADQLFAGVRAAGDYVARSVDPRGRFDYDYDPIKDAPAHPDDYALIRHAGVIYAMMEAFEELRVVDWATAADRAIRYLLARAVRTPDGSYVRDDEGEEQQKVGGGGLTLVALAKYQAATSDARYFDIMRDFARFIVHQQYPDGHFRDDADVKAESASPKGKKPAKEVFFYTGEAALGLVRFYALDPNPAWLAAARKAADWVIDVRDAHDDLQHQTNDHWMAYTLHDLYVLTGDKRYADHAFKIAHAIEATEPRPPPTPDFDGSFYDQGEVASTSTRIEALASAIELARFMGQDDAWLRALAGRYAAFTLSQQLNDDNGYFVRNPSRAAGGVRESMLKDDVRIDFDQHAASAWLRLARELRDPSWGKK